MAQGGSSSDSGSKRRAMFLGYKATYMPVGWSLPRVQCSSGRDHHPLLWSRSAIVAVVTVVACSGIGIEGQDLSIGFNWPEETMGQRTSDRVSAGKRAAKYIACSVCEERVLALFPTGSDDVEAIGQVVEQDLPDQLGDAKKLCEMRGLAKLFRSHRLEIRTNPDGTASVEVTKNRGVPFYEEINTSELAFHWKSFALQHACTETFRRDGDAVTK